MFQAWDQCLGQVLLGWSQREPAEARRAKGNWGSRPSSWDALGHDPERLGVFRSPPEAIEGGRAVGMERHSRCHSQCPNQITVRDCLRRKSLAVSEGHAATFWEAHVTAMAWDASPDCIPATQPSALQVWLQSSRVGGGQLDHREPAVLWAVRTKHWFSRTRWALCSVWREGWWRLR